MTTGYWVKLLSRMFFVYAGTMLFFGILLWEQYIMGVLPDFSGRWPGLLVLGMVYGLAGAVGVWWQRRTPPDTEMRPQPARTGGAWSLIVIGSGLLLFGSMAWVVDPTMGVGPVYTVLGSVLGFVGLWRVRADLRA